MHFVMVKINEHFGIGKLVASMDNFMTNIGNIKCMAFDVISMKGFSKFG